MCEAAMEMPRYKSHKQVWALKIAELRKDTFGNDEWDGVLTIVPEDTRYAPIRLEPEFVDKHKPQVGGYFVVYKDGYKSFSPADAFEDGYTIEA